MTLSTEADVAKYVDQLFQRKYGWLTRMVGQATVTAVLNSATPFQVQIQHPGEAKPDGSSYTVLSTGYRPQVGDQVTMLRQDEQVAHVLAPLAGPGLISAGGLTKLFPDIVVSGAALTTVDFTNIPQNYRNLMVLISAKTDQGASQTAFLQVNGDTGAHYDQVGIANNAGTFFGTLYSVNLTAARYGTAATESAAHVLTFPNYSGAVTGKQWTSVESRHDAGVSSILEYWTGAWTLSPTAPISHLSFGVGGGGYAAGSTFSIYGF